MSEQEAPKPPKPTSKTSTVPLKKETVRISLRAKPGEGITQPKKDTAQTPTAEGEVPPSSVTKPPVAKGATSKVPAPPAPPSATSVSLKLPKAGSPPPPPSAAPPAPPSVAPVTPGPVTPAPSAPPPAPAATIALKTTSGGGATSTELKKTQKVTVKAVPSAPPGAAPARTVPLATKKAAPGAAGTQALPKATVKLQQPGPGGAQPSGAIDTSSAILLEDEDAESGLLPFAIATTVLSLVALIVTMMSSNVVGLGIPEIKNVSWEKNTGSGWTSTFGSTLPEVPVYK